MKINKLWITLVLILIIILSIITQSSLVQIIAAVCGVIYVFTNIYEKRFGQVFGMINSILYAMIMYSNGLYGTAIYDIAYCFPLQIYTFFNWGRKDKEGKAVVQISRYDVRQRIVIFTLLAIMIVLYAYVANMLNIQFALVDGMSIILGAVGLWMTSKKKIEQWTVFITANIATIVMWSIKSIENIQNIPMLAMWIVYLINNSCGLYSWHKKLKANNGK